MADKYESIVKTVEAIQFTFESLKDIYFFLNFADVSYSVKGRTLSGILTNSDGLKLNVNKNDFVVKDSKGKISVWKEKDFNNEFVKANS